MNSANNFYNYLVKNFLYLSPIFLLISFIIWANLDYKSFEDLATQERIIEIFQAFFYFTASACLIYLLVKIKSFENRWIILYLGLNAFAFLFIGMEEISWGQKILDLETPETLKEINYQGEITLHNIDVFQKTFILHTFFILFGLYFVFSKQILTKAETLYPRLKGISNYALNKNLVLFFLIPSIYYFHLEFFSEFFLQNLKLKIFTPADQEMFEFILSLGVVLYAFLLIRGYKYLKKEPYKFSLK